MIIPLHDLETPGAPLTGLAAIDAAFTEQIRQLRALLEMRHTTADVDELATEIGGTAPVTDRRSADVARWCEFYRETCGFDAAVRPELDLVYVTAGAGVGSVRMPAPLGALVETHLRDGGIQLGPVIELRDGQWVLLVEPDIPDRIEIYAGMFRHSVSIARAGAQIALPTPGTGHSRLRTWLRQPRDAYLPSGTAVLAAVDFRRARRFPIREPK
ncbi:hypothetical protein D5S18_34140 [Nocardia panacis]|uniref:Uncharacterized protein n=1 Tax=Nocardia panacis TaxID=2340916 RepID=A0A3A4JQX2_9NOCA|nr:hypothetical protein [Nocardia panacis]RJO67943.1 hypothetical protein D5S18_34140 [Nocardia panacis]